jgi:sigma-B regulation protein RsbU (phosphoserine phosphatase)
VLIPDHVAREGLRAALHAGLVFQDKPIGVMRLYARRPRVFTEAEKGLLRSIAHQAAVAVEQARLLKLQERDARIQRQVELAADVQRRMLPRVPPPTRRFDLAARWIPTFELAGDFYDFIDFPGRIGVTVGDVVGKGIAAGLLMASARAWIRAYSQETPDVRDVIARVNRDLCRDTLINEFVTLWYAIADEATLELSYCSAGHEPPFVVRRGNDGDVEIIDLRAGGMVAGVEPETAYELGTFSLQPGDTLVAYTDGLTDARNFSGEKLGRARLIASAAACARNQPGASATEVVEHILRDLRHFAGLADRDDDLTLVVLRVNP